MNRSRIKSLQAKSESTRKVLKHTSKSKKLESFSKHQSLDSSISKPERFFDPNFKVSKKYKESLPDVMLAEDAIAGAKVGIQHVGISNFRIPLNIEISKQLTTEVAASIVGTVSLQSHLKGINMSRIMRSFYAFKDKRFNIDLLVQILKNFKKDLNSNSARLKVSFSFPLSVKSLRSNLQGYQYYNASLEAFIDKDSNVQRYMEFNFVYSSACPCSSELAEHARRTRDIFSIPHSQRSRAKIRIQLEPEQKITFLELRNKCLEALRTETQVMVKREDEQAFAELNGSHEKFVEDAARLLYEQFDSDKRITDFEVICSHFESLHSHDAISAISKGVKGGMRAEFSDFESLKC